MALDLVVRIWSASIRQHQEGKRVRARATKAFIFIAFRAILPPEAQIGSGLRLGHHAMGVVIHPNVTLGNDVFLWHGVTLSVSASPGAAARLTVGDRVTFGTGAVVVTPVNGSLTISSDVVIGANAVVTRDIVEPGVYVGAPARRVER